MKRLILDKIPQDFSYVTGVAYDGVLDVLVHDDSSEPEDALYVAREGAEGIEVVKDQLEGREMFKHTFAGWPETAAKARPQPEIKEEPPLVKEPRQ